VQVDAVAVRVVLGHDRLMTTSSAIVPVPMDELLSRSA
jgi:hypothetical protein